MEVIDGASPCFLEERARANPLAMNALLDPLESSNLAVEEDEESLATRRESEGKGGDPPVSNGVAASAQGWSRCASWVIRCMRIHVLKPEFGY